MIEYKDTCKDSLELHNYTLSSNAIDGIKINFLG